MTDIQRRLPNDNIALAFGPLGAAVEYMTDAAQRSILYWDVMRRRGNTYREHLAKTAPNVLDYEVEPVVDGRTLEHSRTLARPHWLEPPDDGISLRVFDLTRADEALLTSETPGRGKNCA